MFFTSIRWWSSNSVLIPSLVALLPAFINAPVNAQVEQTHRYEIPLPENENAFDVIAASDKGLFIFRRLLSTREDKIDIISLDTAFQQQWRGFLPVAKRYLLVGQKARSHELFLLFRYMDFSKNDLELYKLNQKNGEYTRYVIKSYIPFSPTEFHLTQQAVLIGGYFNHVPIVLHFSFLSGKSKVLPGLLNENGELTQVKAYEDGSFDILISAKNYFRQQTIWMKNYDADGNLINNIPLEPEDKKSLIFGRSLKTVNNMQVVAGVYGNRGSEYSRGLFVATIDPAGVQQLKYYNFGDLENFFQYMKARRELRIKNRIERRKIKGKKIRFNYRFIVHELIPYKNQYILLGEAFYPRYVTIDRTYYTGFFSPYSYGRGMIQNGRIFDGYYYTHAVVIGFDKHGKLLWDNSFEINDVRTYTLDQFVKLEIQENKIALFYLFDNEIRSKIIQDNKVLEGKTIDPIMTRFKTDIAKDKKTDKNKLSYWYNDFFFATGIQEILNPTEKTVEPKRRVFYINKVRYR